MHDLSSHVEFREPLLESVLSFCHVVSGAEFRMLDLVTSTFTHQTIFLFLNLSSEDYFGKKIVLVSPLIKVPKSYVNV